MNHKHQRRNYAGGYVRRSLRPGGEWWRDLPPAPAPAIDHNLQERNMNLDLEAIRRDIEELDQVLALAEELRYRIAEKIRAKKPSTPAPSATPAKTPTSDPATSRAPTRNGQSNHSDLVRTGRGLYAWAKEHGAIDTLVAIGETLDYPPRLVDWRTDQVDHAVSILDGQQERPAAAQEAEPKNHHRNHTRRAGRNPGEDDFPY